MSSKLAPPDMLRDGGLRLQSVNPNVLAQQALALKGLRHPRRSPRRRFVWHQSGTACYMPLVGRVLTLLKYDRAICGEMAGQVSAVLVRGDWDCGIVATPRCGRNEASVLTPIPSRVLLKVPKGLLGGDHRYSLS